ncbi:MAG: PIN domain-containing protein [Acetobacteraceae bacterium]|nr:PIN domain-containing protein [Acetobacteraceae bacterium]
MSILDSSAIIALLRKERGHELVAEAIVAGAGVCAANMAEAATAMVRYGVPSNEVETILMDLPVSVFDVNRELALQAGLLYSATKSFGLSLGDRLCLALALREGREALTSDRMWTDAGLLLGVPVRLIR